MSKNLKLVKVKNLKDLDVTKYEEGTVIVTPKSINIIVEGNLRKIG